MLGRAAIGGCSRGASQQLSPAPCNKGSTALTSALKTAAQQGEGSSRGCLDTSQQASPGSEHDRPCAAGPQQASAGGEDDVISLMSSVQTTRVEDLLGDDEKDDEVTMIWRSSRGSPAAGARAQPPTARSAPAVKPELVSDSGDTGASKVELEGSDHEDPPLGRSPVAGRVVLSTQPSSAATGIHALPKEQRSLQV